jgi:hypothetical protein
LEKLNDLVGKSKDDDAKTDGRDLESSSDKDGNCETREERQSNLESHKNITSNDVGDEEEHDQQLMNMCQVEAIVSPEHWHRFDSSGLYDPPRTSQWLNFWIN